MFDNRSLWDLLEPEVQDKVSSVSCLLRECLTDIFLKQAIEKRYNVSGPLAGKTILFVASYLKKRKRRNLSAEETNELQCILKNKLFRDFNKILSKEKEEALEYIESVAYKTLPRTRKERKKKSNSCRKDKLTFLQPKLAHAQIVRKLLRQ